MLILHELEDPQADQHRTARGALSRQQRREHARRWPVIELGIREGSQTSREGLRWGNPAPSSADSLWEGTEAVLLFPHAEARPLESWRDSPRPITLVVPDGTWRQANKARRRIPGLDALPCAALPTVVRSSYRLRHDKRLDRVSTIEAVALALRILEGPAAAEPLELIFRIMVDRTLWTNGRIASGEVTGGIPAGVRSHDPFGPHARVGVSVGRGGRRGHPAASVSSTNSRSASNQMSLCLKPGKLALRPLGFGTTKTAAPEMRSGFAPAPPLRGSWKNIW